MKASIQRPLIQLLTAVLVEPGGKAPETQTYDLVLQAVGRSPNGKKLAAEKAGVAVTDRGFIPVDIQMRTNVPHIFAIDDISPSHLRHRRHHRPAHARAQGGA